MCLARTPNRHASSQIWSSVIDIGDCGRLREMLSLLLAATAAWHAPIPYRQPALVSIRTPQNILSTISEPQKTSVNLAPPEEPTRSVLLRFYVPCLALWLSAPLLSLVDTSAVGLAAKAGESASQLAALGPSTTFCDGASYLFAFLNVATTNLYASSLAARASGDDAADPTAVVRRASKVALICGIAAMAIVCTFAKGLLSLYVGSTAASDPRLIVPATAYVTIRAISLPAALVGGVLQAALLGAKNSAGALVATGIATIVNVFGDLFLVSYLRVGLVGAAIATTVAQCASTYVLIRKVTSTILDGSGLGLLGTKKGSSADAESRISNRSFLAFAAPVLALILGKIAAFGFMTHSAAGLGALSLASHQITLTIFFFLLPFFEVTSQVHMQTHTHRPSSHIPL